jgi:hypothetical protein
MDNTCRKLTPDSNGFYFLKEDGYDTSVVEVSGYPKNTIISFIGTGNDKYIEDISGVWSGPIHLPCFKS